MSPVSQKDVGTLVWCKKQFVAEGESTGDFIHDPVTHVIMEGDGDDDDDDDDGGYDYAPAA
ncbi:hypothetical protein CsatB_011497 [Cannabis sativa]